MSIAEYNARKAANEGIPYQELFYLWHKVKKWEFILICTTCVFSFVLVFWFYLLPDIMLGLKNVIEWFNCFLILIGIALNWYANIHAGPIAEYERVGGFVDDAFETRILEKSMAVPYYTNGGMPLGVERMAANGFENCFFTNSISEKMTKKIAIKNMGFFSLFLILAYLNVNVSNITALLQIVLGSVLLEGLIKHWYFRRSIKELFERYKRLYDNVPDAVRFQAEAVYLAVRYEKYLAYYNYPIDTKIYTRLNLRLSVEWENMKERYNIRPKEN